MDEKLKKQIEEFREKTEQFSKGEINVSEYKSFSGKFGSYAQRGAKAGMLRPLSCRRYPPDQGRYNVRLYHRQLNHGNL